MVRFGGEILMLTYSMADIGSDKLYQYLYKQIRNDITSGVLTVGTKLPSKRAFAGHLSVSTITIENAYNQLMVEGYIYSKIKSGYFVADIKSNLVEKRSDVPENHETADHVSYEIDFTSNQVDPDNYPFNTWTRLLREVMNECKSELVTNSPSGGVWQLRKAIADHLLDFRGVRVKPEQVIVGAGTEYLYGILIQLLGHDLTYAVENPGYQKIVQIYKSNRVKCEPVGMDGQGIIIADVEKATANVVHISPGHHFPTGIITPVSRRYELLGWAAKQDDRYIIEDDFDSEFRLLGTPIPPLLGIDQSEKVIYMNTFSKTLASTIRISYMVLPPSLMARFQRNLGFYSCTVSNFEQYTLARFIECGHFEMHINRMRTYYRNLRNELIEKIKISKLADHVAIMEEDAGLHFLLKVTTTLPDFEIIERAGSMGLKISCLAQYYDDSVACRDDIEHIFLLNYSSINKNQISKAIAILGAVLEK